jgi:hypothetical protein
LHLGLLIPCAIYSHMSQQTEVRIATFPPADTYVCHTYSYHTIMTCVFACYAVICCGVLCCCLRTQTPDGPLPLLHSETRSSSAPLADSSSSGGGGGDGGRAGGGGKGGSRRSLLRLQLPRQRPQPLVTSRVCGGYRMYRPRTTCAALLMLSLGAVSEGGREGGSGFPSSSL